MPLLTIHSPSKAPAPMRLGLGLSATLVAHRNRVRLQVLGAFAQLFFSFPHHTVGSQNHTPRSLTRESWTLSIFCASCYILFLLGARSRGGYFHLPLASITRRSLSQQRVPGRDCAIPPRFNEKVYISRRERWNQKALGREIGLVYSSEPTTKEE